MVKENADLSTRVAKLDEAYVEQDKRHEEFAEQQVKARDAHTEEGREAIKDLGAPLHTRFLVCVWNEGAESTGCRTDLLVCGMKQRNGSEVVR